jgi:hypothetical protein
LGFESLGVVCMMCIARLGVCLLPGLAWSDLCVVCGVRSVSSFIFHVGVGFVTCCLMMKARR